MKAPFNLNFFVILCVGFVDYIGIGLVYPVFSVMLFDHDYGLVDINTSFVSRGALLGALFSATPLSQFLTSQLLGVYSDNNGRRIALIWAILAGCVGYAVAVLGIMLKSLTLLFIYTILSGISDSSAAVAQAAVVDMSTEKTKGRLFGYFNSSLGLGFTIGPFIGGKLADPGFDCGFECYALPFIAAGIVMVINLLLVIWKFKETHKVKSHQPFKLFKQLQDLAKALKFKNLKWMFLGGFAFSSGWSFFNEFTPILWIERFQFSTSQIGNFYGYSGFWYAICAAFFIAPLLKRFSPEKIVVMAAIGCGISLSLFSIIENDIYIWIITPFIIGFLAIVFPMATTVVSNHCSEECQGEVLGIFQAAQALAMGLIPLIFGAFVGYYPVIAVWGGVISMAVAAMSFWVSPIRKKRLKI
jgi:DHA1 family tetracycline resistance protein-like MFS transporter